jgi:hypothetical protein
MYIWSLNYLVELFMLYSDYTMTTLADYNRDRKGKNKKVWQKKRIEKERERKRVELLDVYANRDREEIRNKV